MRLRTHVLRGRGSVRSGAVGLALIALLGFSVRAAAAATAERDLSGFSGPGRVFTVTITLDVPLGTIAAGVEDQPPAEWVVSNISNGGEFDDLTGEVKWGPFFDPSIPAAVAYDVTPPSGTLGIACFVGTVTIDISSEPVAGDPCISLVPLTSTFGTVALGVFMFAIVMYVLRQRSLAAARDTDHRRRTDYPPPPIAR